MVPRFLATLIFLPTFLLLVYSVLLNPAAEHARASQEPRVINKTTGCELKSEFGVDQVTITLKNNHNETVTAFSIAFEDGYSITADFAYSEVHSGIAPGDTFKNQYPLPASQTGPATSVSLLTVLLENGGHDGDPAIAKRIRDERLGEKIQVLRALRILERQENLDKHSTTLRNDVAAALSAPESETLITLNELQPTNTQSSGRSNDQLTDEVKMGLNVGREKVLRRLDEVEQLPTESRQTALTELKVRLRRLLTKL